MKLTNKRKKWIKFLLRFSHLPVIGKQVRRLACIGIPPYYHRIILSRLHEKGYISPKAQISHNNFQHGNKIYIDDRVLIYEDNFVDPAEGGGKITFGEKVHIHRDTIIQTGRGGSLIIANETHIQPRCQINAYLSSIKIGSKVEIAPNCAFYSYNHGTDTGEFIANQPISTKGGIIIEDDVWIGFGVIILDGVTIGKGSVIAAGSVVTKSIQENTIAAGTPARVIKSRTNA
jgi:acetyltransferase-like isoleucine patch superfamily enzyme